jgi:signal transduction histidine kinase
MSDPIDVESVVASIFQRSTGKASDVLAEIDAVTSGLLHQAPEHRRPALQIRLEWSRVRALNRSGALREALATAVHAEQLATRHGDHEARGGIYGIVASCFQRLGHHQLALQYYDRALRLLENDFPVTAHRVKADRTSLARTLGRLDEAAAAYDTLLTERYDPVLYALTLINAASTWRQVRRYADAARALDEVDTLVPSLDRDDLSGWSLAMRAWLHADHGNADAAFATAEAALAISPEGDLWLRSSAARAMLQAASQSPANEARVRRAEAALEAVAAAARRVPLLGVALEATQALADLAERRGDPATAVRHLRAVHELAERRQTESEQLLLNVEDLRLALLRQQLDVDHLAERISAVSDENRSLQDLDARRVALLRSVSHDLRGPLTGILGSAYLLSPADPSAIADLRDDIVDAVARVVGLLDRVLSDSAIREGVAPVVAEPIDLRPSIARSLQTFASLAERKQQRLSLEAGALPAVCDPVALCRVIDNLVANAIKYVPNGGEIVVRGEVDDQELRLCVEDNGRGFPSPDPSRALLRGDRLGTREAAGHGVGLHNVYDLVSRLGGVVELSNRPEGGARARIRVPRAG